jgi:hypothetical protein
MVFTELLKIQVLKLPSILAKTVRENNVFSQEKSINFSTVPKYFKDMKTKKDLKTFCLKMWHSEPPDPDPKLCGNAGSGSGSVFNEY